MFWDSLTAIRENPATHWGTNVAFLNCVSHPFPAWQICFCWIAICTPFLHDKSAFPICHLSFRFAIDVTALCFIARISIWWQQLLFLVVANHNSHNFSFWICSCTIAMWHHVKSQCDATSFKNKQTDCILLSRTLFCHGCSIFFVLLCVICISLHLFLFNQIGPLLSSSLNCCCCWHCCDHG